MRKFRWTQGITIRVPDLDAEHQAVFQSAAELERAAAAGVDAAQLEPLIEQLIADAVGHFAHEEQLMRATGCPSYTWHKGQHDTARRKVLDCEARFHQGDEDAVPSMLAFFADWLEYHIRISDRIMGAHVQNAKAQAPGIANTSRKSALRH